MATILNGDKRGRPGRWLVDYRDSAGIRRLVTVKTRDEAKAVLERVLGETRQQTMPVHDPNITADGYFAKWIETVGVTVKARSVESYSQNWKLHLAPMFGHQQVRRIQRAAIRHHLVGFLRGGMARGTVRLIHSVIRALLNAAVADGLITSNPADKIGRQLKLVDGVKARQDVVAVKALNRTQVARLLAAAEPLAWTLLLLLARTGLRVSEAIGLRWSDVNIEHRQITVARATSRGVTGTPKSGHGRTVDMSDALAEALEQHRPEGAGLDALVFTTPQGEPMTEDRIRGAMARALASAELPGDWTPHCLRHTFASLLLQQGESPAYVQRQLGHASIQLTVDLYGKWLLMGNQAAVNRLDDASGSRTVAASASEPNIEAEIAEMIDSLPGANITTRTTGSRPASRRRCRRSARRSRRARRTRSRR
jgi:integrase